MTKPTSLPAPFRGVSKFRALLKDAGPLRDALDAMAASPSEPLDLAACLELTDAVLAMQTAEANAGANWSAAATCAERMRAAPTLEDARAAGADLAALCASARASNDATERVRSWLSLRGTLSAQSASVTAQIAGTLKPSQVSRLILELFRAMQKFLRTDEERRELASMIGRIDLSEIDQPLLIETTHLLPPGGDAN